MSARLSHLAIIFTVIFSLQLNAQSVDTLSNKAVLSYSSYVSVKIQKTEQQLSSLSQRALTKLEKQEQRLYKKLYKIDSIAANNIFSQSTNHYKEAQQKINEKVQQVNEKFSGEYIAYLDTLTNSIAFLKEGKALLNKSKEVKEKLHSVSEKVKEFNNTIQKTEQLKQYISQRKEYLKNQLSRYTSLSKDLTKLNKTVFYYRQQVKEVKEALKDPRKAEENVMTLLREIKPFREFIQRNSFLAGIFNVPESNNGIVQIGNLQTRSLVTQTIQTRLNVMGPNAQQQMQQNIEAAQQQLHDMKSRLPFLNSNDEMPEFKRVNEEKTKTFLKRIEYGANIQMRKAQNIWPTSSDIGLQLGYKLNQKSTFNIGIAYRLGMGTGFNNINFTHQGVGLRAFIDWKIKGSFFVNGGYEQNYNAIFKQFTELKNQSAWQYSGMLGLSKKFSVSKKINGSVLVLHDFLYKQHIPVTAPIIFRTIYTKK